MSQHSEEREPYAFKIDAVIYPPKRVEFFAVTENELDALEGASVQESQTFGFFTGTVSIFATCAVGRLTTSQTLTLTVLSVLAGVAVACGILAHWFGFNWRQAKQQRQKIVQRIKERRRLP